MGKIELLSPVGNKETLYQAIHNGADAIYLASKDFGARKYADNFTKEELKEVIEYAHLYDVKVYITVNTIIYEEEVDDFISLIEYLYIIGCDALIMQDIGMIKLVHDKLPDFEIHASTQCNINSNETIEFLKSIGVKRVVLSRETTLDTINKMNSNIEKEIFIHGALCVSYSGCCLFSKMNANRSGNRGECAGSCRLPYKLLENNKIVETEGEYLLSTKDLNTTTVLKNILESNVNSLKIEGRMKSPEYVGLVTKIYRNLIDKYYNNENLEVSEEDIDNLKLLFNREFTTGYLFNNNSKDITNIKSPNHIGIKIGKVIDYNKEKIKIKLNKCLNQQDGIRFTSNNKGMIANYLYDSNDKLINKSNDIVYLDNKCDINEYCDVLKTYDYVLSNNLKKYQEKKIPITFKIKAKLKEELELIISDKKNTIAIKSNIVEKSKNKPTTKAEIKEKLLKVNDTPFIVNNIDYDIDDNIFIPMSNLNSIRRNIIEQLINKRKYSTRNIEKQKITKYKSEFENKINLNVLVRTKEQLDVCIKNNIDNIYIDNNKLYEEYKNKYNNIYLVLDRVNTNYKDINNEKILVSDLGSIYKYKNTNTLASDYFLNIINSYSVNLINSYNINRICLSIESSYNNTKDLITNYRKQYNTNPNIELFLYGKIELMISKYCLLNKVMSDGKTCSICQNNKDYFIEDSKNKKYKIINKQCKMHIFNHENLIINNINKYLELGITNYRINLLDETKEQTEKTINNYLNLIKN